MERTGKEFCPASKETRNLAHEVLGALVWSSTRPKLCHVCAADTIASCPNWILVRLATLLYHQAAKDGHCSHQTIFRPRIPTAHQHFEPPELPHSNASTLAPHVGSRFSWLHFAVYVSRSVMNRTEKHRALAQATDSDSLGLHSNVRNIIEAKPDSDLTPCS